MRHINAADQRQIKAYRLQVKERLYRFNFVSLRTVSTYHLIAQTSISHIRKC